MKVDKPSDQALDELKRYTENLLSFFDSKASVKISTNKGGLIQIEVVCEPLTSEDQLNCIALKQITCARMKTLYPDKTYKINLSIKRTLLVN